MRARRGRGDAGQVGGIEVLPLGFLVFVAATLLLVNVWAVIDAKFAVTAAAREAVRAFVEADDPVVAAQSAATRARETLDAYGRGGSRADVDTPVLSEPFGRCVRVTITVSYRVAVIELPFLGGLGSMAPVEATHTGIVDPYRSGPVGAASC